MEKEKTKKEESRANTTLILIHGAGSTKVLWDELVDRVSDDINVVAIDLPGHGDSGGTGRDTVKDYAATVLEFVKTGAIINPVPCGLSMGGAIVLQLLLDYSDIFHAGILINTGAKLRVLPAIFEMIEKDYNQHLDLFKAFAISEKTDRNKLNPLLESLSRVDPRIAINDFKACDTFDVMDRIAEIAAPVLIITSEEDRLTPPKYGAYLEENIPNARRVHITDAGHLVCIEKPIEVGEAIIDFLKGL